MRRTAWVAVAWVAAVAVLDAADDIKVTPLVVSETRVDASFAAPGSFSDDATAVMKSGLVLTFTYTLEVRRPARLWFDTTLGRVTVAAAVQYDSLADEFQVSKSTDGQVVWSETTKEEAQVRAWMTEFEKIQIQLSAALEPNADYYVSARLHANPRRQFSIWPWGRDDGSGRADFPYIR